MNEQKASPASKYEQKCYAGREPRIHVSDEFIERNRFSLNRTPEEIEAEIKRDQSFGGFGIEVLTNYLPWDRVRQFYNPDFVAAVDSGVEKTPRVLNDIHETTQDMLDYLVFGWDKALDQKGLSASRTIEKIGNWLWLLGRDDLKQLVHNRDLYNPYGMPALIALSESLGIEVPEDCREFAKHKC